MDTIIDSIFFHPDDYASISYINALRSFKCDDDVNRYKVTRDDSLQFSLIADLIAVSFSFQ